MKVVKDFKIELHYDVTGHKDGVKRPKLVTYYLAELEPSTEIKMSHEHQDFKWLTAEEAAKLCGFKDLGDAFRKCLEKIERL